MSAFKMTKERWVGLAVIIITVLLTMMAIAVLEDAEGRVPFDCFDPTERERVRELSLVGIDKGLEQAISHLYTVWQKDPDSDQPKRAQVGVANAINAHARARRFTLAWMPPTCPPTAEK
jgi:hypothetical protein